MIETETLFFGLSFPETNQIN